MRATGIANLVAAASLCGVATGQLVLPNLHNPATAASQPLARHDWSAQKPLSFSIDETVLMKAGQFTKKQQDGNICPTYGESQWTGTIDVTDTRRLFYWYFDSRNDPENDPIIIWMNGGPGASSMMGLFNEAGPCYLVNDTGLPTANEWAWNNNASLLFLDQPAGVGFASVAEDAPIPGNDMDGAQDFQQFLNIFFSDVFPSSSKSPIHIAGESYGGHYGPTYLNHILQSRRYDAKTAFWGNITSLILINALVDFASVGVGVHELLCEDAEKVGIFNQSTCDIISRRLPELHRLGRNCDIAYDGMECLAAFTYYQEKIAVFYQELIKAGKHHAHNIHWKCHDEVSCQDASSGNLTGYLNQDHIKKALDIPVSKVFQLGNTEIGEAYAESATMFAPTTQQIASILEAYSEHPAVADIKILVLNGNDDFLVNSPGTVWAYDHLRWSGQAEYRIKKWRDLPDGMATTGSWKATRDGRLAFVRVDGAGHVVPADVREGSYNIMQKWLHGEWHT